MRSSIFLHIIIVLLAILAVSCADQNADIAVPSIQDEATADSSYYLQQLQQSSDSNKTEWQLLAIRALLREGNQPQANNLLSTLPTNLPQIQLLEQQLLSATAAAAQGDKASANATLNALNIDMLSPNQHLRYYQIRVSINQGHPSLDLLRAYIAVEPYLNDSDRQDNLDKTWQTLTQMTPQQLNSMVINANENILQGWLDLYQTYQNNKQDTATLQHALIEWQTRYPQNPAAKNLPTALKQSPMTATATSPTAGGGMIALLLPLSGQAQVFGSTIQQGFDAARHGQQTSVDASITPDAQPLGQNNSAAQVKVYDTTSATLPALLAQAQQDGAALIVGPLLKNDVEQLTSQPVTMNILALNQPENLKENANICYFALSPEDEARDAAKHIQQQQKQMPLLLTPIGSFGDRIAKAFADEWQKQGGQRVLQQRIGSTGDLKQAVNSGRGIALTGTPVITTATPTQSVSIAGLNIPLQPSPNTGADNIADAPIDAVYIVATQEQLTLIKPMLDMASRGNRKLGLFASSRSYQSSAGPDYRLEMEGVQFSDIPLLSGSHSALLQQVSAQFKNDYSLVRLYAMGMDAWALAQHFTDLRVPGFQLDGNTGVLSSSAHCVITRSLPWLQYHQGQIVPVM